MNNRLSQYGLKSNFLLKRAGFSLVEIVIAVMVLGLIGGGLIRVLLQNSTRTAEGLERQTAMTIAKAQLERIRAAGPLTYNTPGEIFQVNSDGARIDNGPYKVSITRHVLCKGGAITEDSYVSLLGWACGNQKPIVSYSVYVDYPARTRKGTGNEMGQLSPVGVTVSFGDAELTGQACPGGQVWNPASNGGLGECLCPGGQIKVDGNCMCPAGQAWDGISCRASTCPGPFTEYEVRNDCPGGQTGNSQWRKDRTGVYCTNGTDWQAWYQVARSCVCPAATPDWNGTVCACNAASSALTRAPTCAGVGGQLQATPDRRTFTAGTCTLSAWVPGTCSCPSPQVLVSGVCRCSNRPTAAADTVQAMTCSTGQASVQNRTRSFDTTTCTYTAWAGGVCRCTNAPSAVSDTSRTRTTACTASRVPSGTERRDFNWSTCVFSAWSGGVCSCPSGQLWNGTACYTPVPTLVPTFTASPTPAAIGQQVAITICVNLLYAPGSAETLDMRITNFGSGQIGGGWQTTNASNNTGCITYYHTFTSNGNFTISGEARVASNNWVEWSGDDFKVEPANGTTTIQVGSCAGAGSEYTPCTGGQTGNQVRTRTCNPTTSVWGAWGAWSSSACSCPSGTTWNGTVCYSTCSGSSSETAACDGGRTGTMLHTRTCSGSTWSAWSNWDETSCTCASGTTWNGVACVAACSGSSSESIACGNGQAGNKTRVRTCSSATWSDWSDWDMTSCSCPSGTVWDGSACSCTGSLYETRISTCPSGTTGTWQERRDKDMAPNCTWGDWYNTTYTCAAPAVCDAPFNNDRTDACPYGQTGVGILMRQTRPQNYCQSGTGWSAWSEVSRDCQSTNPNLSYQWVVSGYSDNGSSFATCGSTASPGTINYTLTLKEYDGFTFVQNITSATVSQTGGQCASGSLTADDGTSYNCAAVCFSGWFTNIVGDGNWDSSYGSGSFFTNVGAFNSPLSSSQRWR